MKPIWEIYHADDITNTGQKVWLLDGPMVQRPLLFHSLSEMQRYIRSYHQDPVLTDRKVTKLRSGDSSTPKHPYDRPDGYWEEQDAKNSD